MPRSLIPCLLALLPLLAHAGDLEQRFTPGTLQPILDHLQHNEHPRFAVVDYSQRSDQKRFLLYDRDTHELLASYRVAHGKGSDADHDGYAERFSNEPESHASALGAYRTGEVYRSEQPGHGLSMRLAGLDPSNDKAMQRAIVIHAMDYMEDRFIRQHGVAGRSFGCLVLSGGDRDQVIEALRGGALIFAIRPTPVSSGTP